MYEVVIAQASGLFADILSNMLKPHACVRICEDPANLLTMLSQKPADVLVLDMELPGYDGIEMVARVNKINERPAILATASYSSDFLRGTLAGMGVGYVMVIPCHPEKVMNRVVDMLSFYKENLKPKDLLRELNLPERLDGTKYLRCAIPLLLNDPNQSITKELYTTIGECFGKNPNCVERNIRNAIHSTWQKHDGFIWQGYFGEDSLGRSPRPSNTQFMELLVRLIANAG